jgi:signal transduction histidine kinase
MSTSPADTLARIRDAWVGTATRMLVTQSLGYSPLAKDLPELFDRLVTAVSSSQVQALEPVFERWLSHLPSVLERVKEDSDVSPNLESVLHTLRMATLEAAQTRLKTEEALELLAQLEPVFAHSAEYLAAKNLPADGVARSPQQIDLRAARERLDKSRSNFIAVAAHELRTPLTLIQGYSSMLREMLGELDDQTKPMLDGIDRGTQRLAEIVQDLIDVAIIDNDTLTLVYQPTSLSHLLALARRDVEQAIQERRQRLHIYEFPGCEVETYADPERLLQAILNVLYNAIKYTPDGGEITIGGRCLPGFAELVIADTGIGIPVRDQTRIFETFGRVGDALLHSSGKTKFRGGGPGLGLPIARGILEAHGGAIWVESSGRDEETCPGSTFHLLIPLRQSEPAGPSVLRRPSSPTRPDGSSGA